MNAQDFLRLAGVATSPHFTKPPASFGADYQALCELTMFAELQKYNMEAAFASGMRRVWERHTEKLSSDEQARVPAVILQIFFQTHGRPEEMLAHIEQVLKDSFPSADHEANMAFIKDHVAQGLARFIEIEKVATK